MNDSLNNTLTPVVSQPPLHWADYLVLAAFLVISLGIGVYHSLTGGRQRTTSEFIMANRSLSVLPTALSMLVSFQSAISILSNTAEMYQYGTQYFIMTTISFPLSVALAAACFVTWLYPLKLVSVYEYLDMRFNSKVIRTVGALLGLLTSIIYMGTSMYAPSLALQTVTGLSIYASVPIMAAVAIAYTALGGMKAVIWTDVFQFVVMICGLLAILIRGVILVGGVDEVVTQLRLGGRGNVWNWSFDPRVRHTVWGFLIGHVIHWTNIYALYQASVQRYSAIQTVCRARVVVALSIPGIVLLSTLVCFIGLVVFAYYSLIGCDPVANGDVTNDNQILARFVVTIFSEWPGFTGLFLATLYGGALSSISSALSGAAANCWEDILKWRQFTQRLTESRKTLITKLLVIFFGILSTSTAFLASAVPGTIIQVMFALGGAVAGPLAGAFLLGGWTRRGNWKGATAGCIAGLCFTMTLNIGTILIKQPTNKLPPVSVAGCNIIILDNSSGIGASGNNAAGRMTYGNIFQQAVLDSPNPFKNLSHSSELERLGAQPRTSDSALSGFKQLLRVSYIWYTAIGVFTSLIVGYLASLAFNICDSSDAMNTKLDTDLLWPCYKENSLSCCLRNSSTEVEPKQESIIQRTKF